MDRTLKEGDFNCKNAIRVLLRNPKRTANFWWTREYVCRVGYYILAYICIFPFFLSQILLAVKIITFVKTRFHRSQKTGPDLNWSVRARPDS